MPIAQKADGTSVLTLNDVHLTRTGDAESKTAKEMGLSAEIPPRLRLASCIPSGVELSQIIAKWADGQGLVGIHSNHAVLDAVEKFIYVVDAIFEDDHGEPCLALFYYSVKRGGSQLPAMKAYATRLLAVCRQQMRFYPRVSVVCIYAGEDAKPIKTCTYKINILT
jgi:hypothetical protein